MSLPMVIMLLVNAIVAAVEIQLVRNLAAAPSQWLVPLAIHLAISATLIAAAVWLKLFRDDKMWPLLTGITVAATGPIGAIGSIVALLLTVFHRRKASSFEDWYEALFPESIPDFQAELMVRIRSNDTSESQGGVSAFADILAFGTVAQKRELITLMTKHFEPRFAGVLKLALDDANNATRVQAASAVAKIQDDFSSRSMELRQSATSRDPEKVLELARHHDEHAKTGLLDPDGSNASRGQALDAYRRYLEMKPDDVSARSAVGRLLLQSGKFEEACAWLKDTVDRGAATHECVTAYMEALFRLQRFGDLRTVAKQYAEVSESWNAHDESIEALKLWAQGYDAAV
jgi:tetratricopeptide (TPR) repeat protein